MARQLVQEIVSYAESSMCRRMNILRYFGEEYDQENCGNCDNCLHPKPRVETKEEMVYVLETILAMKQAFNSQEIVDVITTVLTPAGTELQVRQPTLSLLHELLVHDVPTHRH